MKRADGGNDLGRQSQRPRLEVDVASSTDDTRTCTSTQHCNGGGGGGDDEDAAGGVDIDLICNIASFMNPGDDLAGLCVAVGSADAARIRTEYLRDNEQYVAASLAKLKGIPDLTTGWDSFCDNLHVFDKCRDNVTAWMQVNTGWRDRCTDENMERYKGAPLRVEANLVFNNPAVAIEVGLLEVVRFHVEEKGVDVNHAIWNGFSSDAEVIGLANTVFREWNGFNSVGIDALICLALVRCDIEILEYLMSVDGFDFSRMVGEGTTYAVECDIIDLAFRGSTEDCFKAFICHPKVNVNAVAHGGARRTPLYFALSQLRRLTSRDGYRRNSAKTISSTTSCTRRVLLLLQAGANPSHCIPQVPRDLHPLDDISMIEYARNEWNGNIHSRHWRRVVETMEAMMD
mmetsp:Transcript_35981/g.73040  ORF Transcript_35981/g.73040 Transcript_35981/m.73040 type:complete len:401 (-) Transcript_35981:1604-2806(-)